MGIGETFVIPLKLRWPKEMFTLREIFYNGKFRARAWQLGAVGVKAALGRSGALGDELLRRGLFTGNRGLFAANMEQFEP